MLAVRPRLRPALLAFAWTALSGVFVWPGCGGEPAPTAPEATPALADTSSLPATALPETRDMLLRDLAAPRHASDGGGRAWLEAEGDAPPTARAGTPGRWTLVYEAGPLGVAEGGMVLLQVSPFWGWSTPQVEAPDAPGYTEVRSEADGVRLEPRTLGPQLLGIRIAGRALAAGERLLIVYGAGPAGALADRYAERQSRFWFAVDGDGDGVRQVLADSPGVDVAPGPPARLVATLPSTARPGDTVTLTLAVLDAQANAGVPYEGTLRFSEASGGLELPEPVVLVPADAGTRRLELRAGREGLYRIRVESEDLAAESNPMLVSETAGRVLWGDLQVHTAVSDGTGLPEDVLRYARDVAGLDVVALTDHDHWGMLFLDRHPEVWEQIRAQTRRFHAPGRFVSLLGFEWTNWIHGHRHVLYFEDDGEVLSSLDAATDTPRKLWDALRGKRALTLAHHPAGGPVATDWSVAPDPDLEPVTEIVSVHGSSEAADAPGVIYGAHAGHFVRDALDAGLRLGVLGSSDGHDGHPGLSHLGAASGGLAAILSEERTREGVLAALRARRVYATNGPRILLRATLGGRPMGAIVHAAAPESEWEPGTPRDQLAVWVVAPGPLERVDVIRSGRVVDRIDAAGRREFSRVGRLGQMEDGEYVYVRAVQEDGGAAWSSPFFVVR